MHLGNRYSSLPRIPLENIRENTRVLLCILKCFLLSLDISLGHPVLNIWLQNQVSDKNDPQLWPSEFSASQKLTESKTTHYSYGTYFDRKCNRKKSHNSLFLMDQTQRTRNILKALHVCINV